MHGSLAANRNLLEGLASAGLPDAVDVAVCPPFAYLQQALSLCAGSALSVGAQDCSHMAEGAYTGEVSAPMLADLGCRWVIIGHSERRQYHRETSALIAAKVCAAADAGLAPIICVGETREQREGGEAEAVVAEQLEGALADFWTAVCAAAEPQPGSPSLRVLFLPEVLQDFETMEETMAGLKAIKVQLQTIRRVRGQAGRLSGRICCLFQWRMAKHIVALRRATLRVVEAAEACLSHPAPLKCCDAQMLRNTLVSCVALFASDGMMVVFGEVADRAGPRAAFAAGAALAWAGFAFMALYSFVRLDGVWFAALACLGRERDLRRLRGPPGAGPLLRAGGLRAAARAPGLC